MNEILFELLKVVIMVAVMLITRYAIPWVRERIGADKLALLCPCLGVSADWVLGLRESGVLNGSGT